MKKLLLIALVVTGFAFAAAPEANAGVSIGIGLGVPVGYGYGYPYGYGYGSPYGYRPYYAPVVYAGPSFYWSHGRRVYYSRVRHHHRNWR